MDVEKRWSELILMHARQRDAALQLAREVRDAAVAACEKRMNESLSWTTAHECARDIEREIKMQGE